MANTQHTTRNSTFHLRCLSSFGRLSLNISIDGSGATKEAWEFIAECVAPDIQSMEIPLSEGSRSRNHRQPFKISGHLPLLESLDFTFYNPRPISHFDEAFPAFSAPLLQYTPLKLAATSFPELSLPLHNLTNLDLNLMRCRYSGQYSF